MHSKIEVRGLNKSYESDQGRLVVIDDVSFTVRDGETVAIIGPSGCGKTTLMNMIAGFVQPDGPMMATVSPSRTVKLTSSITTRRPWSDS